MNHCALKSVQYLTSICGELKRMCFRNIKCAFHITHCAGGKHYVTEAWFWPSTERTLNSSFSRNIWTVTVTETANKGTNNAISTLEETILVEKRVPKHWAQTSSSVYDTQTNLAAKLISRRNRQILIYNRQRLDTLGEAVINICKPGNCTAFNSSDRFIQMLSICNDRSQR